MDAPTKEIEAERRRALTALEVHRAMVRELGEIWKPIPLHEHPQLTSEPD